MIEEIQKQGRSPFATLQQNKRDDVRLFFIKKESSHFFCASAENSKQPNTNKQQPTAFSH